MTEPRSPRSGVVDGTRNVPDATVARLATYLGVLPILSARAVPPVPSEELAPAPRGDPAQLRRGVSVWLR